MEELIFAGNKYISSKRAAKLTGYTTDYLGQMCRGDKMNCRLVGRNWYINEISIDEQKKIFKRKQADDTGEIKYKKIELEPMYYSNDERVANPEIDKTISCQEEDAVEKEESRESSIPVRIIKRPEVATRTTHQHQLVVRSRVERQVIRRQPIVPQRISRKPSFVGILLASVLFFGILFTIGTLTLERVVHYTSSDKGTVTSELQLANVESFSF